MKLMFSLFFYLQGHQSVSSADYKLLSRTISELGPTVEMYEQLEKKQNVRLKFVFIIMR